MNTPPIQNSAQPNIADSDPLCDPMSAEWERNYSMAMHLTLLAIHIAIPMIPAVVLYIIKKDESPFVKDHGREAINFQITLIIYAIISGLLVPICGLGFVALTAVYVLAIVGMILAAVAAKSGKYYRYPSCIRFLGSN